MAGLLSSVGAASAAPLLVSYYPAMLSEPLTRASFASRLLPIAKPKAMPLVSARVWTDEDWDRIQRGYGAGAMEEKWNVLVEGQTAFAFRSWTGRGIFEASFVPCEGGWRIGSAVVESKRKHYRSPSEDFNGRMLYGVLSGVVLGEHDPESDVRLVRLAAPGAGRSSLVARVVLRIPWGQRSQSQSPEH